MCHFKTAEKRFLFAKIRPEFVICLSTSPDGKKTQPLAWRRASRLLRKSEVKQHWQREHHAIPWKDLATLLANRDFDWKAAFLGINNNYLSKENCNEFQTTKKTHILVDFLEAITRCGGGRGRGDWKWKPEIKFICGGEFWLYTKWYHSYCIADERNSDPTTNK